MTSYCPLGSKERPWKQPGDLDIFSDPKFSQIGEKYGKSAAQIMIRYNLQLGNIVIPKSSNKKRIIENIDIFDFELSEEDMIYINSFDCNGRICQYLEYDKVFFYPLCFYYYFRCVEHPDYPFKPEVEF